MKVRARILSPSVGRGIAIICAAAFVTSARPVQAGINIWTSHGPAGVAASLAIDPATPGTLHFGVVLGPTVKDNVFKSTDGGGSWSATGLTDIEVNTLAIDPKTPSTLYAAGSPPGRVFNSTDGAGSWQAANAGLPNNTSVFALAIDPRTPSTLYVGTNAGVFKSTDGASTWVAFQAGLPDSIGVNALGIDPQTPSTLYAATDAGVFSIQQVPAHVVGTGTAASCTDAALNTALAGGGLVTFNCGGPATIDISSGTGAKPITIDTTVDGGGLITITGDMGVFSVDSGVNFTVGNLTIAGTGSSVPPDSDARGGIYNNDGTLTVSNSTFTGNRAGIGGGGGIYNNSGSLTVVNSTFTENRALFAGGGIFNVSGSVTITDSTFTGNRGGLGIGAGAGGGISNSGSLSVTNSTFTDNIAGGLTGRGVGGAIDNGGSLMVTNSTFTRNRGNSDFRLGVAGIANGGGSLTVTNSTFTGNEGTTIDGSAVLRNTVVASSPENCSGAITDGGHNLDDGTSCGFSTANGSLSGTDPHLDPAGLQDNGGPTQTVALCTQAGVPAGCTGASPAIDAGDQAVCAAAAVNNRDQRGFGRPGIGHTQCSIGAYEADATVPEACTGDCNGNGIVAINELILGVNIALGLQPASDCPVFANSQGMVDVAQLVKGVSNALDGCGAPITDTAAPRPRR